MSVLDWARPECRGQEKALHCGWRALRVSKTWGHWPSWWA